MYSINKNGAHFVRIFAFISGLYVLLSSKTSSWFKNSTAWWGEKAPQTTARKQLSRNWLSRERGEDREQGFAKVRDVILQVWKGLSHVNHFLFRYSTTTTKFIALDFRLNWLAWKLPPSSFVSGELDRSPRQCRECSRERERAVDVLVLHRFHTHTPKKSVGKTPTIWNRHSGMLEHDWNSHFQLLQPLMLEGYFLLV